MRIAFVRSVDLRQAAPTFPAAVDALRRAGHRVRVFVADDIPAVEAEVPGAEVEILPGAATPVDLAARIKAWGADRVVSISVPDDKALRDSVLRELLEAETGIPVIIHPPATVATLCSKWDTRVALAGLGFAVPPGFLLSGDLLHGRGVAYGAYQDYVERRLAALAFPVMVKPVWDSMATGVLRFDSPDSLRSWLWRDAPPVDLVVEEFVDGELYGIEVIGADGEYVCQPLIRKCTGRSEDFVPFNHIRFGPVDEPAGVVAALRARVVTTARALDLRGSAEFELVRRDDEFYVIEVNPRVSGMTNLSSAISGRNAYERLALLGTPPVAGAEQAPERFVVEVPLTGPGGPELRARPGVVDVATVVYHDGSTQSKALLTAAGPREAVTELILWHERFGVVAEEVLREFEETLAVAAI